MASSGDKAPEARAISTAATELRQRTHAFVDEQRKARLPARRTKTPQ